MSKNLRISSRDSSDDYFVFLMPAFVLCIRDFTLDLEVNGEECTEDKYLEHCLRTKEGNEKYNRPRECIKKYFAKRKAFTFDRPAPRKLMRKLDEVKDKDLSEDFLLETANFKSFIYECQPKMFHNKKSVTGGMIAELLTQYVDAMKREEVPCVADAITVMSKMENERRAKAAVEKFKEGLRNITLPVPNKGILLSTCIKLQTGILTTLNAEMLFDDDHRIEKETKMVMERIYQIFEEENSEQLNEKCYGLLTELYDEEVKDNVSSKKYLVAGGYERYKRDMEGILDKYTNQLSTEHVDPMEIQRAKKDFCTEKYPESEDIMTADKNISEKEKEEEMKRQEQAMKQEFEETQKREQKQYTEELQRQNKRHEDEIEVVRKAQEEKDKTNTTAYLNERLAQSDMQLLELVKDVAYMKGREAERNKKAEEADNKSCPIM